MQLSLHSLIPLKSFIMRRIQMQLLRYVPPLHPPPLTLVFDNDACIQRALWLFQELVKTRKTAHL